MLRYNMPALFYEIRAIYFRPNIFMTQVYKSLYKARYVLLIVYNSGKAEGRQTGWGSTIIILGFFIRLFYFCVAKLVPPIPLRFRRPHNQMPSQQNYILVSDGALCFRFNLIRGVI